MGPEAQFVFGPLLKKRIVLMNVSASISTTIDNRKWLKRAGAIGFWFFFVKGTLWLAAPLVFYYFA